MNNKVPHRFKWIISTLKEAGISNPLIAGGAVRDLYFKRPYRDIDVYVHTDELIKAIDSISPLPIPTPGPKSVFEVAVMMAEIADPSRECKAIQKLLKADSVQIKGYQNNPYYDNNHICCVYQVNYQGLEPVELIVVDINPLVYFNDFFNIGICKAYFNGSKLHYGPDFMSDVTNKTLTIVGQMDERQLYTTLSKHVAKLLQYFPKYDVRIIPDRVLKK